MKDEKLENMVVTLHRRNGWSIRRLSHELGISRKRIRRVLASNAALRDRPTEDKIPLKKRRASKLDPHKEFIAGLVEKYPKITAQRVFELLTEKGYDGKITVCRDYVRSLRGWAPKHRSGW